MSKARRRRASGGGRARRRADPARVAREGAERDRCPHCGTVCDLEAHATLRQRCVVCGGPRVPLDDPEVDRTGNEEAALAEARSLDFQVAAWRLGALIAAGFASLAAALGVAVVAIASPSLLATFFTAAVLAAPWLFAAWAWAVATRRARARSAALDRAWESVASDVVAAADGHVTPEDLAGALRLGGREADALVARLGAAEDVITRLGADGDVLLESLGPRKVRVAAGGRDASGTSDLAEEDAPSAEAEGEPARAERARRE